MAKSRLELEARMSEATGRHASAKKTGADRKRKGQERQAEAKKAARARGLKPT
jgi:hypothetical protein